MLGIVLTYLPRLERREVVGTDGSDADPPLPVVLMHLLESL